MDSHSKPPPSLLVPLARLREAGKPDRYVRPSYFEDAENTQLKTRIAKENGVKLECLLGHKLYVKSGESKKRQTHFCHYTNERECADTMKKKYKTKGGESQEHLNAKAAFADKEFCRCIELVNVCTHCKTNTVGEAYRIDTDLLTCELEHRLGTWQTDCAFLDKDSKAAIVVEVKHTHGIDATKRQWLKDNRVKFFEVESKEVLQQKSAWDEDKGCKRVYAIATIDSNVDGLPKCDVCLKDRQEKEEEKKRRQAEEEEKARRQAEDKEAARRQAEDEEAHREVAAKEARRRAHKHELEQLEEAMLGDGLESLGIVYRCVYPSNYATIIHPRTGQIAKYGIHAGKDGTCLGQFILTDDKGREFMELDTEGHATVDYVADWYSNEN